MTSHLAWTDWMELNQESTGHLPEKAGVYEIACQNICCTVYIGSAAGRYGLRQRLRQRSGDPQRFLSGHEKWLRKQGCRLMFRCAEVGDKNQAKISESQLIDNYIKDHGHLPHGNKRRPQVGEN